MKKRVCEIIAEAKNAVLNNPVEVCLSLLFCLFGCFSDGYKNELMTGLICYFPVFFLAANILNKKTKGTGFRVIYYLSAIFFVPFLWIKLSSFSPIHIVSLVVIQLLYLICEWQKDNDKFTQLVIRYLVAITSALFLAGAATALSVSIFFSTQYIFDIWQQCEERFITSLLSVVFVGIAPLIFLLFSNKKEYDNIIQENKLIGMLLNYILSPALLIYGTILSLYFLKIAVQWSLPKGDVAYIVISFTSAAFILKGFQNLLSKPSFGWFYNNLSLVVIPALTMYWIGTCYRINEYGFTEPRVYLVVIGVILTIMAILFLSQRWGRYLYAACLVVGALSVVTYIPGITASDIETISQSKRGNYPERREKTFFNVYYDGSVDINGFRTMQSLGSVENDSLRLNKTPDSLYIYKYGEVIYKESDRKFLQQQLLLVGLNLKSDSIPQAAFPEILRLDIDSASIVFDRMVIERDSIFSLTSIDGGVYLER